VQRFLLWERRNNTVMPFNETVQQVFARVSALRDSLDGPQVSHHPSSLICTCCLTSQWVSSMVSVPVLIAEAMSSVGLQVSEDYMFCALIHSSICKVLEGCASLAALEL